MTHFTCINDLSGVITINSLFDFDVMLFSKGNIKIYGTFSIPVRKNAKCMAAS